MTRSMQQIRIWLGGGPKFLVDRSYRTVFLSDYGLIIEGMTPRVKQAIASNRM